MDIVVALNARYDYDQGRDKFLGRCFGAKFKDDEGSGEPLTKDEATAAIRAAFSKRSR